MTGPEGTEIGTVIAGRYRVERVLGQGGMGIVVQAMHVQLQQRVAIKFLRPTVAGAQQAAQRFLREAQAAVRLKSEHVARVMDVGTLDSGAPFMVLELLEGTDLASVPRSQLTVGGIIDLLLQACEALAEAHSLGIVHRDVKPANFFITRGAGSARVLKVLDFGISKAPTANGPLTMAQTVMGTPAYMSPEQMRSARDVDPRTDIWALGVALYELVQGSLPFAGNNFSAMINCVLHDPPAPLTVALPDGLADVIMRCLEKDPAHRFQNVAELACAIAKYAQSDTQATLSAHRTRDVLGFGPPPPPTEPPCEPDPLDSATTIGHLAYAALSSPTTVGHAAPSPSSSIGAGHAALSLSSSTTTVGRGAPSTLSSSVGMRATAPQRVRRWSIAVGACAVIAGFAIAKLVSSGGTALEGPPPAIAPSSASQPGPAGTAPPAPAAPSVTESAPGGPAARGSGEGPGEASVPEDTSAAATELATSQSAAAPQGSAAPSAAAPGSPIAKKPARPGRRDRGKKPPTTAQPPTSAKPLSYDDPIFGTRN